MNQVMFHFSELFAQLGLPSNPVAIGHFLTVHNSMADGYRLPDAPYWTPSQALFLRESLLQDSDWAVLVDQLSKALQGTQAYPAATPDLATPASDALTENRCRSTPDVSSKCNEREFLEGQEDPAQSEELERQQDA